MFTLKNNLFPRWVKPAQKDKVTELTSIERSPNNRIDRWIAERVAGLTFCDIGGIGLRSKNERVSTAARNGAARSVMIDFRRKDFPMWAVFHEVMKTKGITNYEAIYGINLESPTLPDDIGIFDFVHSTGILYHAPSPVLGVFNLSRVTRRYLIVNTVTVPSVIENEAGRLTIPSCGVLFLPALKDQERAILKRHYIKILQGWDETKFDNLIPDPMRGDAPMPYIQAREPKSGHYWEGPGGLSYTPYWWAWHEDAFRSLVTMMGFRILDEHNPRRHALALLCERVSGTSSF